MWITRFFLRQRIKTLQTMVVFEDVFQTELQFRLHLTSIRTDRLMV